MDTNDSASTQWQTAIARLPECLRADVMRVAHTCAAQDATYLAAAPRVWAASEFVAEVCLQHTEIWSELVASGDLARAYEAGEFQQKYAVDFGADVARCKHELRRWRRRELARIAWRDLAGSADLAETIATLSAFADHCIAIALSCADAAMRERHGVPRSTDGTVQQLTVFALGKLGGGELNFSSDIDLVLGYAEDGDTDGGRALSNHEFFLRVAREFTGILSEATGDGFVFRVDLRLRPNGNSGPLALSFDAMEIYFQTHGREWERYAWIKARAVAGDVVAGAELLQRLRPFVYRKYIDFGALAAIRALKDSIARELERKGQGHNIKTGWGGIREIEFIGQAFQLIRGGRDPALQARPIQTVLPLLAQRQYLTAVAVDDLLAAYVFLRNTEHRLQMLRDRQTHVLPDDACERERLAFSMGCDSWAQFAQLLQRHQAKVHTYFEQVFSAPQADAANSAGTDAAIWGSDDAAAQQQALMHLGYSIQDAETAGNLIRGLRHGSAYHAFSTHGRERMDVLMPLLIAAAVKTPAPALTLQRLIKLIEAIGRRSAYFALLIENPMALSQLVKLCAASAWIADWLGLHPVLLDELLNPATLYTPLSRSALNEELDARLGAVAPHDLEAQMEVLREFRHGHVLRVAAAEIGPGLAPEAARHFLCDIAETVVARCLAIARSDLATRHGVARCGKDTLGFAVIAYGKLGSFELGYASDLDIIFLHEACAEPGMSDGPRPLSVEQLFARLGQRLIHLLATRTAAGFLYQVDMRLRPSGQAGPLVTNLQAFADYQAKEAWIWEHQALVRARAIAGDAGVMRRFAEIRREMLCREREPEALRQAVLEMRARMAAAQTAHSAEAFDLKHDRGGIVDIEFMVQYWVLRWAAKHPQLVANTENAPILAELRTAGLVAADQAEVLIEAYHRYLSIEQRLKLMEHRPLVRRADLGSTPAQVAAVWQAVFNER